MPRNQPNPIDHRSTQNDWIEQGQQPGLAGTLRAALLLVGFLLMTLPLMPIQAILLRLSVPWARRFPHWYHGHVCRLLGIRIHMQGQVQSDTPVLLIANHSSWLDIPVVSAVAPVSFVAKREVDGWPFVAWLARLQRTIYVDRTRRAGVAQTTGEMLQRLNRGDTLVLFAEGTSSDGNRVLPFKTSLLAAVKPSRGSQAACGTPSGATPGAMVQTLAIAYTHLHGLPLGRADRCQIAWYGDMEMGPHAWQLLQLGPIDVTVSIGPAVALDSFSDRKALARHGELDIRADLARLLRGQCGAQPGAPTGT